jgi:sn-glycerol 3-phosphate transport system permease protein
VEKRVVFRSGWLPWVLGADRAADGDHPGVLLLAGRQALLQSVQQQDAFGTSTSSSGWRTSQRCSERRDLPGVVQDHGHFLGAGGGAGPGMSLLLAVMADRVVKGAGLQDAADLALCRGAGVAGVLWLFMFAPPSASCPTRCAQSGFDWNHLLNGNHAMALIVMAAVWKQISYNFLFFLAGLQSSPSR